MARKPNYRFERKERERMKAEKKAARHEKRVKRQDPGDSDSAEMDPGDGAQTTKSDDTV